MSPVCCGRIRQLRDTAVAADSAVVFASNGQ
jgi:hypothetical protein